MSCLTFEPREVGDDRGVWTCWTPFQPVMTAPPSLLKVRHVPAVTNAPSHQVSGQRVSPPWEAERRGRRRLLWRTAWGCSSWSTEETQKNYHHERYSIKEPTLTDKVNRLWETLGWCVRQRSPSPSSQRQIRNIFWRNGVHPSVDFSESMTRTHVVLLLIVVV